MGTVFVHFEDKTDLLRAALFSDLERTAAEALAALPADGPVLESLRGLSGAFLGYYARRPALSRVLLEKSLMAQGEWGGRFRAQVQGVAARVYALLLAAVARGELPAGLDCAAACEAYFSFYYFALIGAAAEGFEGLPARLDRMDRLLAQQLGLPQGSA